MRNIENFVIEWGVLKKYKGEFSCVIIPNGITEIGENAFSGCEKLRNVFIPKSVVKIGKNAFKNCKNLHIAAEVDGILSGWCQRKVFFGLFTESWNPENCPILWGCKMEEEKPNPPKKEKRRVASSTLKVKETLEEQNYLRKIGTLKRELELLNKEKQDLQAEVELLIKRREAEQEAARVQKKTLGVGEANSTPKKTPPPIKKVKKKSAQVEPPEKFTIEKGRLVHYHGNIETVAVPNNVVEIGERVFAGLKHVKAVILPKSVKIIDKKAFYECEGLLSIMAEGVEIIDDHAFTGCKKLHTLNLGDSVKRIGIGAFYGCLRLKEIQALGVEALGDYAFFDCNKLVKVELGNNVTSMGAQVFGNSAGVKKKLVGTTLEEEKPVILPIRETPKKAKAPRKKATPSVSAVKVEEEQSAAANPNRKAPQKTKTPRKKAPSSTSAVKP